MLFISGQSALNQSCNFGRADPITHPEPVYSNEIFCQKISCMNYMRRINILKQFIIMKASTKQMFMCSQYAKELLLGCQIPE